MNHGRVRMVLGELAEVAGELHGLLAVEAPEFEPFWSDVLARSRAFLADSAPMSSEAVECVARDVVAACAEVGMGTLSDLVLTRPTPEEMDRDTDHLHALRCRVVVLGRRLLGVVHEDSVDTIALRRHLNIERTIAAGSRTLLKPTAFDGLMSALWTARNIGEDDYGVTGGGVGEFLEAGVTFAEVTSANAVIPDDDFLLDIQRVKSQVANVLGDSSTPTEERLRGNHENTSILNTTGRGTGGALDMYDQVTGRSTEEQNSPSAPPTAPGAARETTSAMPAGPAAAPGGAYDMTNGPRSPR